MVSEHTAAEGGGDGHQHVGVHLRRHGHGDGDHDGEGAPAGTRAEGDEAGHDEDQERHQGGGEEALGHIRYVNTSLQLLTERTDGEGQEHQQGQRDKAGDALQHQVYTLADAEDALGFVESHTDQYRQTYRHQYRSRTGAFADGEHENFPCTCVRAQNLLRAGPARIGQHERHGQHHHDDGQHHVPEIGNNAAFGRNIGQFGIDHRRCALTQYLSVVRPNLCLFHRSEITLGKDDNRHEQQRQDGVKVVAQRADHRPEGIAEAFVGQQRHDESAPTVEGNEDGTRRGTGIRDVRQLLPADAHFIENWPVQSTHRKHTDGALHEDQGTREPGQQLHNDPPGTILPVFVLFQLSLHESDETRHPARSLHEHDECAHQRAEHDRPRIARIGEYIDEPLHGVQKTKPRVAPGHDHVADENTDNERDEYLPCRDGQNDGHQGRKEGEETKLFGHF